MSTTAHSWIAGTGSAFPRTVLTNAELATRPEPRIETSAQWIREMTGIEERRISQPGDTSETASALGARAALQALQMAGRKPTEVDAILCATCTPDQLIPSTACRIQNAIGAPQAWAMDLNAACSGFVYGLHLADALIRAGTHRRILVIGAEVLSAFTNWADRNSCILFGDGAGAVLIEATPSRPNPAGAPNSSQILHTELSADGTLQSYFEIPAGGSSQPLTLSLLNQSQHLMQMKGGEMYKAAVRTMTQAAQNILARFDLSPSALQWVVPHQANLRIMNAVLERLGLDPSHGVVNIDRYGNTSAATIPTALDGAVRSGQIRRGDLILFNAFGAGVTGGVALVRF